MEKREALLYWPFDSDGNYLDGCPREEPVGIKIEEDVYLMSEDIVEEEEEDDDENVDEDYDEEEEDEEDDEEYELEEDEED